MYHCLVQFYLVGRQRWVFDPIRQMAPLERFTHLFMDSSEPDKALAEKADRKSTRLNSSH